MTNHKWDMKQNYMLAFTVCKYGLNSERWDLISKDLADFIDTTPQICKAQFGLLCQQYSQDWQKELAEPLDSYVFSTIKRIYYGDLCGRMAESRDLLMAIYDFIHLFKTGRLKPNDIGDILHDIKNSASTDSNIQANEREQKIKMLERLKSHMTKQVSIHQYSSCPVELLPPLPPAFHHQPIIKHHISQEEPVEAKLENDRQVPSIDNHIKSETTYTSPFPIIAQSNNVFLKDEKDLSNNNNNNNNQSNEADIEEIELSSNNDDDGDDRVETGYTPHKDEPINSTSIVIEQDESSFMSAEQTEINESLTIPPLPPAPATFEVSNSNDRYLYEHASSTGISNQSTSDTRLSTEEQISFSSNVPLVASNHYLNTNVSSSNDNYMFGTDQVQLTQDQNRHVTENESISTTSRRVSVEDNETNQMDTTEQSLDAHTDVTVQSNHYASFAVDETVSNADTSKASIISKSNENDESTVANSSKRKSRLRTVSISNNYRKSIMSVLANLKTAKYGSDFAKPLKSFKLPEEYYVHVKKPLDIPEIRERMNNGDYDDNLLLFERDILLMFTNALSMYHRDLDIHGHAQFMLNYAMELFLPIENARTPWKNDDNQVDDNDSSSMFHRDNETDSDDNILNTLSNIRTPSKLSPSSSSSLIDSSTKSLRRQTTPDHRIHKRQRKTIQ
ncbi:unnamed protein product [Rotaria socialis]|uniref:Bromo domain-containing protein n=1 Tax=Rotaria socialis TaxID=392032 RepID=A0A820N2Q4_9BILA|nr:unnamed protein product [Rotaria socialis]CAF4382255.1 unnamed protein product [Rotaria socialis]